MHVIPIRRAPGNYFLAHNATITGDVSIGELSSVWFNAVIRADVAPITIGRRVNVQDAVVIHCDADAPNVIEDEVTIGHRAIVHGVHVGTRTLIGMGAILLSGTRIGNECIIGAGSVVPPNTIVPDRSVVMGIPGKVVRPMRDADLEHVRWLAERYVELAEGYLRGDFMLSRDDQSQR